MQIELGRKGDYSVRAVLNLARHYGRGRRKAREIAAEMDIPERYLPQILAQLVHHGLLVATAGPDGGYELSRDPRDVTLIEVVEAAEGEIGTRQCVLRGGPCDWENVCPVHEPWSQAQQAFVRRLQATTFRQLARADAAIEAGERRVAEDAHPERRPRRGVRTRSNRGGQNDR